MSVKVPSLSVQRGIRRAWYDSDVSRLALLVLYVLAMVAIIIGVDVAFLREHFWVRLLVNVSIVALFGLGYFLFLKKT